MIKKQAGIFDINIIFPIIISLVMIALLFVNFPTTPKSDEHTTKTTLNFGWAGFASRAFVDDNPRFTSPLIVEKNVPIVLEPGEYYWKTDFFSPINSFTVDSKIAVAVVKEDENGENKIKNEGNIAVLLEFFKNFVKTGQTVLELDESLELNETNDTKIIASQYGDNKK